jgi:hypothetical protein
MKDKLRCTILYDDIPVLALPVWVASVSNLMNRDTHFLPFWFHGALRNVITILLTIYAKDILSEGHALRMVTANEKLAISFSFCAFWHSG